MAALTLERLRLLHAVAARGSIAAAARDAGFTASAVSQQLSALERELGAALLERSNRGASLTPAGLRLSERAAAILDLADAAAAEVRHGATGADPVPLRLGAFPTAITSIVVPAMAALGPRIALTVVHLEPEQALVELVERRLDAAVVDAYDDQPGPEHAGLRVVDLLADRLRVAVSGDVRPRDVRDLAALPWILAGPRARLGRSARAALRAAGLPAPSVLLETDEHALAYAVMRDVAAATVQPELALRGAPRHVHALRGIDLGRDRRIRLVTRALRHPHPATAALESALAAAARLVRAT